MHGYRKPWSGYRVYLSGPMTGYKDHNFPAFNIEAQRLRNLGYKVTNPVEVNPDMGSSWQECLRNDVSALAGCDSLVLMPGWQESEGAMLELQVAFRLGLQIRLCEEIQHGP